MGGLRHHRPRNLRYQWRLDVPLWMFAWIEFLFRGECSGSVQSLVLHAFEPLISLFVQRGVRFLNDFDMAWPLKH